MNARTSGSPPLVAAWCLTTRRATALALALAALAGCGGDDAAGPTALPFSGRFALDHMVSFVTGASIPLPVTFVDTLGAQVTIVGATLAVATPTLAPDTAYGVSNDTGSATYEVRFRVQTADGGAVVTERVASGRYHVRSWVAALDGRAGWDLTSDACFTTPASDACYSALFASGQWANRGPLWTQGQLGAATTRVNVGDTMRWTSSSFVWRRE